MGWRVHLDFKINGLEFPFPLKILWAEQPSLECKKQEYVYICIYIYSFLLKQILNLVFQNKKQTIFELSILNIQNLMCTKSIGWRAQASL